MSELRYFRRLAMGFDPWNALIELEGRRELWQLIKLRQEYDGSAHRDTETIVLRGPETAGNLFDNLDCVDYPHFVELGAVTRLLQEALEPLDWRLLGRIMIVKLKAGGRVLPHTDQGAYARFFARFHLVLESNPLCRFYAGGESVCMAPGELWWFNHQVEHQVENDGPDRTHVIVDLCAPGFTGALG